MTFEQWVEDKNIEWKMPLMGDMVYEGVNCVVILSKLYYREEAKGEIVSAQIRPKNSNESIGKGAGFSITINFH